jgi:hypothetical protein
MLLPNFQRIGKTSLAATGADEGNRTSPWGRMRIADDLYVAVLGTDKKPVTA